MIIKNKDLEKMLKEKGKQYVFTMYVNRFFDMTNKQRDYVMSYEGNDERKTKNQNRTRYKSK